MTEIQMRGTLMDNDSAKIMRHYGFHDVICPADVAAALAEAAGDAVECVVNSEGGMLTAGTEIYCALSEYGGRVSARVQSCAASAATVLMMAAAEITAEPVSLLCIHNPTMYREGDERAFAHGAEELRNIKESLLNAYERRMKLTREEIAALMDRDLWLSANQALEYGLIDRIEGDAVTAEENARLTASGTHLFPTPEMRRKYGEYLAASAARENALELERARLELLRRI